MAEEDYSGKIAEIAMGWVTAGNTEKVYADEPVPAPMSGYSFGGVDPKRVYSLKDAAECIGMSYDEIKRAVKRGSVHTVRATWDDKHRFVRGTELLRVMSEEFVGADDER